MSAEPIVFLPLTKGKVATIDFADFHLVRGWRFCADRARQTYYALSESKGRVNGKAYRTRLHRLILGLKPGDPKHVDHIDRDGLNNTRANLRICTPAENNRNRMSKLGSSSAFLGVSIDIKRGGVWKAQGKIPNPEGGRGKNVFLGRFEHEEDAAHAYDAFAREHYGEFARCNFPLSSI